MIRCIYYRLICSFLGISIQIRSFRSKCTKIVLHLDYLGRSILFKCTTFAIKKINHLINNPCIMKTILSALGLSLLILTSCGGQKKVEVDFIQDNIDNAVAQNTIQTDIIEKSGRILNPRTINKDGSISYIPIDDWCSGFFPGSIWLTYNLTGDKKWLPLAEKYTEAWKHGKNFPVH